MQLRWITAFIDVPDAHHGACATFWQRVTDGELSESRGDHGEFRTIVPRASAPYLKIQNTGSGGSGVHLDLHVDDRDAFATAVVELGGRLHTDYGDRLVVTSPGGMRFCLVDASEESEPLAATRNAGGEKGRSVVDQVVIDVSPDLFDAELGFFADLTGWELADGIGWSHETDGTFGQLIHPDQPLRLLVQRLEDPIPLTRAHLDLHCSDLPTEERRHLSAGARLIRRERDWTVLAAPAGHEYCLTERPST